MTRFDASTAEERRALIADAVAAHRERESLFCTVEADELPSAGRTEAADGDERADDAEERTDDAEEYTDDAKERPAWIQFSEREAQLNLDCTDPEYDRITSVLSEFPSFTVAEQSRPEDAEGRNLRIQARADAERIAEVVDRLFVDGFGYEADLRLWVTEL